MRWRRISGDVWVRFRCSLRSWRVRTACLRDSVESAPQSRSPVVGSIRVPRNSGHSNSWSAGAGSAQARTAKAAATAAERAILRATFYTPRGHTVPLWITLPLKPAAHHSTEPAKRRKRAAPEGADNRRMETPGLPPPSMRPHKPPPSASGHWWTTPRVARRPLVPALDKRRRKAYVLFMFFNDNHGHCSWPL